jgi:hypothetical protein
VTSTTWEAALSTSTIARPRTKESVWHRPIARSVLVVALTIMALNMVDAFSTLHHLEHGAEEVNPLMRALLDHGPLAFLVGKHILACGGVVGIVAHAHHSAARRMLRYVLLPVYLAIATYQLILFFVI